MAVFPAHAGMSRPSGIGAAACLRFPRSRGDEPALVAGDSQTLEFSPLTRG